MDSRKAGQRTGIGSFLLGVVDLAFSTLRQLEFIRNQLPEEIRPVVSAYAAVLLMVFGIFMWWKYRPQTTTAQAGTSGDGSQGGINQTSHGPNSPTVGGNFTVGGDFHQTVINAHVREGQPENRPLTLTFDPADPNCVRQENGLPREYRVRVTNTTGASATEVRVKIESTDPELRNYRNVPLHVCHGATGQSSVSLANGASEYFNLMEYNPLDPRVSRAVLHICHTATTLDREIRPVKDYEFRLRAYSTETTSEVVAFKFKRLTARNYSLNALPSASAVGVTSESEGRPDVLMACRHGHNGLEFVLENPGEFTAVNISGLPIEVPIPEWVRSNMDAEVRKIENLPDGADLGSRSAPRTWTVTFGSIDKLTPRSTGQVLRCRVSQMSPLFDGIESLLKQTIDTNGKSNLSVAVIFSDLDLSQRWHAHYTLQYSVFSPTQVGAVFQGYGLVGEGRETCSRCIVSGEVVQ